VHLAACGLNEALERREQRVAAALERRDAQIGMVSLCAGGAMGSALILERT